MKYVPPYGVSDVDASYVDGDATIGRQGSIPPAAAFEHPQREIVSVITNNLIPPDSADLAQSSKGIRSQRMNYCEDTGSVNTLSVALVPPIGAYTFGLPLRVKVYATNTGPCTIDAGAGRVPIRRPSGTELNAGDLNASGMAELVYDGTIFQMINFGGAGVVGPPDKILYNIPYCVDSSVVRNQVIANFSPAITSGQLVAGFICMVKISNTNDGTNNGASTINVNGLGTKSIFAQGGNVNWTLLPGDIQVGDVLVFTYDGTQFWVYGNSSIKENVTLNVSTTAQIKDLFAALVRKRISLSGSLRILMAAGVYTGKTDIDANGAYRVITTYHADAQKITLEGTMQSGQTPPLSGHFQRSGPSSAARANDATYNLQMLRARYATEIRPGGADPLATGIEHQGPGKITFKNILFVGTQSLLNAQYGFSAPGSQIYCWGTSVWGAADSGYYTSLGGGILTDNAHACACGSRGFTITLGAVGSVGGGGSYGNVVTGVEVSHGGRFGANFNSVSIGFQSTCNGNYGLSSQSGFILFANSTAISNGSIDLYAYNMGLVSSLYSSVGSVSPAYGSVGNYNSVSIYYG
jgi:hypothetical protein